MTRVFVRQLNDSTKTLSTTEPFERMQMFRLVALDGFGVIICHQTIQVIFRNVYGIVKRVILRLFYIIFMLNSTLIKINYRNSHIILHNTSFSVKIVKTEPYF